MIGALKILKSKRLLLASNKEGFLGRVTSLIKNINVITKLSISLLFFNCIPVR